VAHVGSVQRDRAHDARRRERRPRGQAEVRVHDVVAAAPAREVAERARQARVSADARQPLDEIDVQARQPPQRGDLVAHEHPAGGVFGRGSHVRDDEGAHLVAKS